MGLLSSPIHCSLPAASLQLRGSSLGSQMETFDAAMRALESVVPQLIWCLLLLLE